MFDSEENQSGLNGSHKMAYEIAKIFPEKKVVVCSIPLPDGQKKIDINQILIDCKGNVEKFQKIILNIKNFSRKDFKETDLYQKMRQDEIEARYRDWESERQGLIPKGATLEQALKIQYAKNDQTLKILS